MATTASGVTIPGDSPSTTTLPPLATWFNNLGKSLNGRVIFPVASTTARASYVSALQAEGYTISSSNPAYVDRADAPAWASVEKTTNGTTWRPVGASSMTSASALYGTYSGQPLRVTGGLIAVTVDSGSLGTVALGTGYVQGLLSVTLTSTDTTATVPRVLPAAPSATSVQVTTRRISDGLGTGAGTFNFAFVALGWD